MILLLVLPLIINLVNGLLTETWKPSSSDTSDFNNKFSPLGNMTPVTLPNQSYS